MKHNVRRWVVMAAAIVAGACASAGCDGRSWIRVTVESDDHAEFDSLEVTVQAGGATSKPSTLSHPPAGVPIVFALELQDSRTGIAEVRITGNLAHGGTRQGTGSTAIVPKGVADVTIWLGDGPPPPDMATAEDMTAGGDDLGASRCDDGRKNGNESDVDCGGDHCGPCPNGKQCSADIDCASGLCSVNGCIGFEPVAPWGGAITIIAVDPFDTETVIAGGKQGLFRSRDSGRTWRAIALLETQGSSFFGAAFDPTVEGALCVRTDRAVLYSTDRGDSFNPLGLDVPGYFPDIVPVTPIAVAASSPSTLFVGSVDGVYRTTDGTKFEPTEAVGYTTAITVDPTDPRIVFVAQRDGKVLRSDDGGLHFKEIGSPEPNSAPVNGLASTGGTPRRVYASTYAGLFSWDESKPGVWTGESIAAINNRLLRGVAIDPANRERVFVGVDKGVFRREPGKAWADWSGGLGLNHGADQPGHTFALAVAPTGSSAIYTGNTYGLFRADVAGDGWMPATTGLSSWRVAGLAFDPQNPLRAWVLMTPYGFDSTLFRTDDGGKTWTPQKEALPMMTAITTTVHDGKSWLHVAGNDNNVTAKVASSSNGGDSYDFTATLPGSNNGMPAPLVGWLYLLAADTQNPKILYAGEGDNDSKGLFRSIDGGMTWANDSAGLPICNMGAVRPLCALNGLAFDGQGAVWAATGAGVYNRTPMGGQWVAANGSGRPDLMTHNVAAIAFVAPSKRLLVGFDNQIWRGNGSLGNFAMWEELALPLDDGAAIYSLLPDAKDPMLMWAGTGVRFAYSTDGGGSWATQPVLSGVGVLVPAPGSKTIFGGTFDRGLWRNTEGSL